MPTIVEALKIKHPEATGNTIVDVLKSVNGSDKGDTIDQLIVNSENQSGGGSDSGDATYNLNVTTALEVDSTLTLTKDDPQPDAEYDGFVQSGYVRYQSEFSDSDKVNFDFYSGNHYIRYNFDGNDYADKAEYYLSWYDNVEYPDLILGVLYDQQNMRVFGLQAYLLNGTADTISIESFKLESVEIQPIV